MHGRAEAAPEVLGRDSELTALRGLVAADRRAGALLLTGTAGIGKTALWEAGLEVAQAAGRFVLAARPAKTEAGMATCATSCITAGRGSLPWTQRRRS